MSLAWLAYVPVPGLFLIPAWLAPDDRFTRYHARQGGWLVGLLWLGLVVWGLMARASDADGYQAFIGLVTMLWLLGGLAGATAGIVGTVQGRYLRVRPVWDLLAALGR